MVGVGGSRGGGGGGRGQMRKLRLRNSLAAAATFGFPTKRHYKNAVSDFFNHPYPHEVCVGNSLLYLVFGPVTFIQFYGGFMRFFFESAGPQNCAPFFAGTRSSINMMAKDASVATPCKKLQIL